MRGNQRLGARGQPSRGSIPACAGEPAPGIVRHTSERVYPRVCGGTPTRVSSSPPTKGLSPRVRGNHEQPDRQQNGDRSIPACAGEPGSAPLRMANAEVYPRVCGGTPIKRWYGLTTGGLSPRVRGNHAIGNARRVRRRSIPACAGEPRPPFQRACPARVYPRVCGGTQTIEDTIDTLQGLSPRVRGNLDTRHLVPPRDGSIPACAGEPPLRVPEPHAAVVYPRVCGGTRAMKH